MTPKEKAIDLVDKYFDLNWDWDGVSKYEWAKEGALIAIDEMIDFSMYTIPEVKESVFNYLQQVKQEIEDL